MALDDLSKYPDHVAELARWDCIDDDLLKLVGASCSRRSAERKGVAARMQKRR